MIEAPQNRVDRALNIARVRLFQKPGFSLYESCIAQLEYLSLVVSGAERDRSRLKNLTFGVYAAKEFEDDPEFAAALHSAFWIADRMAMGLKLDN